MKTSPQMQAVIDAIGVKFALNFAEQEVHIRLDLPGYERLCIENIGRSRLSVAHYYEMNGDLVPDPDIVFYMDYPHGWVPFEITDWGGWRQYATVDEDGKGLALLQPAAEADLAAFAEQWAQNLRDQQWLEAATRHVWKNADEEADTSISSDDIPF